MVVVKAARLKAANRVLTAESKDALKVVVKVVGQRAVPRRVVSHAVKVATKAAMTVVEVKVAATVPVGKASLTGSVGYTPDYFNILGPSYWVDATVSYPVTAKLTVSAGIGRQIIDEKGNNQSIPFNPEGYSYTTWNVGGVYAIDEKWSVEARYYNTDRDDLGAFYSHNAYGDNYAVTIRRAF
jgi:hypothetical protein